MFGSLLLFVTVTVFLDDGQCFQGENGVLLDKDKEDPRVLERKYEQLCNLHNTINGKIKRAQALTTCILLQTA
jgi:hypothetical protein